MKKIWIFRMVAICAALAVALGITALPSHLRATGAEAMAETAAGDVLCRNRRRNPPRPSRRQKLPRRNRPFSPRPEPVSAEPTAAPATATPTLPVER